MIIVNSVRHWVMKTGGPPLVLVPSESNRGLGKEDIKLGEQKKEGGNKARGSHVPQLLSSCSPKKLRRTTMDADVHFQPFTIVVHLGRHPEDGDCCRL